MDNRVSLDTVYMEIARIFAKRSSCKRRQVAAVLVKDGRIISTGYNGSPRNTKNCLELNCCMRDGLQSGENLNHCRASHAEVSCISNAAYHGISTKDTTMFITTQPCGNCAKLLINSGIIEIVYEQEYNDELGLKLLNEAGIKIRKF